MDEDKKLLDENIRGHCLGYYTEHTDGRRCAYHARLDMWVTDYQNPDQQNQCLREDHGIGAPATS